MTSGRASIMRCMDPTKNSQHLLKVVSNVEADLRLNAD